MSVCFRDGRSFSAEASFVRELAKLLGVEFSDEQFTKIVELLGEFEEAKFLACGVRTTRDPKALKDGGC